MQPNDLHPILHIFLIRILAGFSSATSQDSHKILCWIYISFLALFTLKFSKDSLQNYLRIVIRILSECSPQNNPLRILIIILLGFEDSHQNLFRNLIKILPGFSAESSRNACQIPRKIFIRNIPSTKFSSGSSHDSSIKIYLSIPPEFSTECF